MELDELKKKLDEFKKELKNKHSEFTIDIENENDLPISKDILTATILLDKDEIEEELINISKHIDNAILFSDRTLHFLLLLDETIDEITIDGTYKGKISKLESNQYPIIIINSSIIDITKINDNKDYEVKEVLQDNLYLCEVKIAEEITVTKAELKLIKTSILMDISYSKLKQFKLLEDEDSENNKKLLFTEHPSVFSIPYNDVIPLKYFLLAEEIEFNNFKFLEYYHVIEYYFMVYSKKKISKIMSDLITNTLSKNKKLDDDFLYNTYKKFMNPHRIIEDEFSEKNQLLTLFEIIEYDSLASIFNKTLKPLKFLRGEVKLVKNTGIDQDVCFNTSNKLRTDIEDKDKENFLKSLAERIYKVRNYIVHTKKGEVDFTVFDPSHKNLETLNNEVKMIREVARLLLVKAASSNELAI